MVTRLAPSPTGALHLGNARTFLINALLAKRNGWKVLLRIEDLDGPRVKSGADTQAIDDLHWLGLKWDGEPIYQSHRTDAYSAAVAQLLAAGLAYPCICTRREAESAASAPHAEDHSNVYPGTCRGRFASVQQAVQSSGRRPAIRFRVPDKVLQFHDEFRGDQSVDFSRLGDFVIAKADATPAYQLAVVVDDADMRITDVVRGDDLLESAARQILLYQALGLTDRIPRWWHIPLVVGTDGRRLAKRHGDTRLSHYRAAGIPAERVLALLGKWCGIDCGPQTTPAELAERFDIQRLPSQPIVFDPSGDEP